MALNAYLLCGRLQYHDPAHVQISGNMNARGAEVLPARPQVHRTNQEEGLIPSLDAFVHPCDAPGNSFHPKMLQVPDTQPVDPEKEVVQEGFRLFPNPANGFFTIIADFIPEKGDATVRVYGATGNLALSSAMQGPRQPVDTSGLHGLYMVVVESTGVQKTAKVILQ